MSQSEIITKLEEIEKEKITPTEFALKSAKVFNDWAEKNPAELERLAVDHAGWCRFYAARVRDRMKGFDMDVVFGRTTQEGP